MTLKALNILFILMLLSGAAFCEEKVAPPSNGDNAIFVNEGEDIVISLDANRTTGYEWQLSEGIDEKIIKYVNTNYKVDNAGLAGAGGKEVWTFKAVGEGKAVVNFKYVRPWEKNAPPAKTATLTITVTSPDEVENARQDQLNQMQAEINRMEEENLGERSEK